MSTNLTPLSTGELLDKTFTLYRNNFVVFAGIAAVANVIPLILGLFVDLTNGPADPAAFGAGSALALVIGLIGTLIASAIAQGGTVYAVSTIYLGGSTSIADALRKVSGKIGRTVLINIAVGILFGLGLILLIIPGLYWLASYSLAIPAALLENLKPNDALTRSNKLSEGGRLKVFLVYLLVYILQFGLLWIFSIIELQIFRVRNPTGLSASNLFQGLLQFGVNTLVFPLLTIALVLVYYNQRVLKEAFDLQHLMEALTGKAAGTDQQGAISAGGTSH
ncbi:MAG TPA: hypothetical protein VG759_15520 [Candidatus Angelobacter sp.]|jgi:hypothetical protein|nr:hypothetical protein [Candidatus Angelobacter sp.]